MVFFRSLLLVLPLCLFAEEVCRVSVDPYYSPYMGRDALMTLRQGVEWTERWLSPEQEVPSRAFKPSVYRWLDLVLFWNPLNAVEGVVQHEVFGHGYRIRSMDETKVGHYQIKMPFPYGWGGGATSFFADDNLTVAQLQVITIGGLEAEEILSRAVKMQFIKNREVDVKIGSLYDKTRYSALLYTFAPFLKVETIEDYFYGSHDIQSYLNLLNVMYPEKMKVQSLRKRLCFNFLDPMTFYQMVASWYYIFSGKNLHVPMITLGKDLSYLPNASVQLAPYGVEYYLENFFLYKESPIYAYVKGGKNRYLSYYGCGLHYDEMVVKGNFSFGAHFDAWYQPRFLTNWTVDQALNLRWPEKAFVNSLKKVVGASCIAVCKYQVPEKPTSMFIDVGFKTKGYLPGYLLQSSPTWRVGFEAEF